MVMGSCVERRLRISKCAAMRIVLISFGRTRCKMGRSIVRVVDMDLVRAYTDDWAFCLKSELLLLHLLQSLP